MAEKLKGLLDRANSVLGGLLGDFPAGFNSGAVAGVAGYPGDIAYMLDTAGRALTGKDTMPAAQDFPGTTDYLAAQAGYPIPQSFSGQLGAAVGGMLTPGPGDLAKFAPVLSAIPFWHGSPHKYDAVDLSKIGTGEGAQAYGHGYYGADSKATAKQYQEALQTYDTTLNGQPLTPDMPEYRAGMSIAANGYDEALWLAQEALDSGFIDPAYGAREVEAIKALKGAKIESAPSGHLYRGEYRWPDPAKEAATPLTGEDLLDWDRPLSEQPEGAKAALRKNGISGKKIQLAIIGDGPDGYLNDRWIFNDASKARATENDMRAKGYYVKPFVSLENDDTGADFYHGLSMMQGNADNASKYLNDLGIPGIRYKDQMSRGSEGGTYNYVLFDEKGIKLLERNGEPIPAAAEFAARREGKPKPYREAMGGQ